MKEKIDSLLIQGNDVNLDIIPLSELVGSDVVCSSLLPLEQIVTEGSRNISTNLVLEFYVSALCKVFITMSFVAIKKFGFFCHFYRVKIVMQFEKQIPPSNSKTVF